MNTSHSWKGNVFFIGISAVIAICIVILIQFTNSKFEELINSANEAVLIHQDTSSPIREELAEQILEYKPEACRMIEVYTSDFEPIITFEFLSGNPDDDFVDGRTNDIRSYTELIELFKDNDEGYTTIQIGDVKEDVYFHWVTMATTGEENLAIMYMSRPVVHNLWIFTLICYIILILVFILIIYSIFHQSTERIRNYDKLSIDARDRMIR